MADGEFKSRARGWAAGEVIELLAGCLFCTIAVVVVATGRLPVGGKGGPTEILTPESSPIYFWLAVISMMLVGGGIVVQTVRSMTRGRDDAP